MYVQEARARGRSEGQRQVNRQLEVGEQRTIGVVSEVDCDHGNLGDDKGKNVMRNRVDWDLEVHPASQGKTASGAIVILVFELVGVVGLSEFKELSPRRKEAWSVDEGRIMADGRSTLSNHSVFTDFARQVAPSQSAMNQGSKWSIFLWTLFAVLTAIVAPAPPPDVRVFKVTNKEVPGGPYTKFCYGFSTIIAADSVKHGYDTVHAGQSANLHYANCEVVVGNLVLTDLAKSDSFDSIKIVTGYLHISNPGTDIVKLPGLQYVLGRELGTGQHSGAAVILEGKPLMSYDKDNNKGTFDVELPNLRVVKGKISLAGLLNGKLDPRKCTEAQNFYKSILGLPANENIMPSIIFGKTFRVDTAKCAALKNSPAGKIEICSGDKGYTTPTGCGKCSAKHIAGFCIGAVCPKGTMEYKNGCYFTCPDGTELDSDFTNGIAKCKACELSFNPGTNQFGYCRRTCYTGFMLPLTRLQFREFYLNPEQGGMRTYRETAIPSATGHCYVVNGNIVLTQPGKGRRWIPSNEMYLMGSVVKVTGMVKIHQVFVPAATFQLLEVAWIGLNIDKTVLTSIDLPLYKGVETNAQAATDARLAAVCDTVPSPTIKPLELKTFKQMYVPASPNKDALRPNCHSHYQCAQASCDAPYFCTGGCRLGHYKLATSYMHSNRPTTFCADVQNTHNVYKSSLYNRDYFLPCSADCKDGCTDPTTFTCKGCRGLRLSTFNLETCATVCPKGFYMWMNKECRRCAPECGGHGCYNKLSIEGEQGCKKCDVSYLSRSDDGIYRIQCGVAGSSGFNANYIEQAFDEFYPKST
uniref:Recep_L_domain domain-containing protein n=1 Tax=Panagrellus redivivus TaxID=6233 RepID=A0A7E4VGH5_PANRE